MLIKTKDSLEPALEALQQLLDQPFLTRDQREAIEEEIRNIRSGARGEKQAAYHIDFRLKNGENYAVVHDLRLEHGDRVAQIDHLIIGRFFDIILVESKNIGTSIRANANGEFEVKTRYGWRGMASPVEQSKRHARVLLGLASDLSLIPKRLGFQIRPTFHHWVLVPPECNVASKPKDATIIKMDLFDRHMDQWVNQVNSNLIKVCSSETIMEFARALVLHHRPITMNFAAKFGIVPAKESPTPSSSVSKESVPPMPESPLCDACGVALDERVINFCQLNRGRFNGKLYCRSCQAKPQQAPTCAQCGVSVDDKVVAFCRFNSRRFGKRVFCRDCQNNVPTIA